MRVGLAALHVALEGVADRHRDDWLNSPGLRPPNKDDTPAEFDSPLADGDVRKEAERTREKSAILLFR